MNNKAETSLDNFVYLEMFEAILAQRLLPGTKLTESDIAKIFKVSRTVVRRALLRLSHDGIVDTQPNKGSMVAKPSIKQAREILEARRLIESAIVRQVIQDPATNTDKLKQLTELVCLERNQFVEQNRSGGIRISGDFHLQLASISGNSTLIDILTRLVPQTSLIIAQYEKPGYSNCSHTEHFELIDTISDKNEDLAVKLMVQHLNGVEHKLQLIDEVYPVDLHEVFSHIAIKS